MNKSFVGILCWTALVVAGHAEATNAVVPRAGKPGPPMLLGTSVMGPGENAIVKSLGFSHSQTDSDHLTVNEPEPGHWDWTNADAGLAAMQKAGLQWQYFPHFHWAPEWYQHSAKFVPATGLRTHRKLAAISIWSPDIVPWFDHCYAALAQHYGTNADKLYAIYLGIHGDFGETIFPMGWHPDEVKRFGKDNTGTPDFWCGDAHARNDFRQFIRRKYRSLDRLNKVWETSFTDFGQIDYPPAASDAKAGIPDAPEGRRYWLDFIQWYYDSMTQYTGEVCKIARHYFPDSLLEIPIGGGSENVMFAQDTTALPKIAFQYGVDTRSTHGGFKPFPENYAGMIKRIATACKIYGAPHWLEPPGAITPEGEVGRFMEALSCGNKGFWDWGANPVVAQDVFRKYKNFLTQEKPVVDIALFFPTTDHRLHPDIDFPRQLQATGMRLRDVMDFDMVDEELIADGALPHYRALIWIEGKYVEKRTLQTMAAWVKQGGVLLFPSANPPQTVEGDTRPGSALLGLTKGLSAQPGGPLEICDATFLRHVTTLKDPRGSASVSGVAPAARVLATIQGRPAIWAAPHGKGWVVVAAEVGQPAFNDLARDITYNLSKLDPTKADAAAVDDQEDGVYATLLANGEAILYNDSPELREKHVGDTVVILPPKSLRSVLFAPGH